jgi:Skp family chaperone for outer membrane proteins
MRRLMIVLAAAALTPLSLAASQGQQTPPPTPPPQKPAVPPPAPAPQPVAFPPDAKIAFVNFPQVVERSAHGKSGMKELEDLTTKKNAEIAAKNKEIATLQEKIKAQQSVAKPELLQAMAKEVDKLNFELQYMQKQAQSDLEDLRERLLDTFQKKVLPIVEEIRKERNLWVVFSTADSGPAAINPGLDITADVIKRLDATK